MNCGIFFRTGFPISEITVDFGDNSVEIFIPANDTVSFAHIFRNFGSFLITVSSTNRMTVAEITSDILIVRPMPPLAINAPAVVESGRNSTFSTFFDSILPVDGSYGNISFSWSFTNLTDATPIRTIRTNRTTSEISWSFENLGLVALQTTANNGGNCDSCSVETSVIFQEKF